MDKLRKLCEDNFFTLQNIYPYSMMAGLAEDEMKFHTEAELKKFLLGVYVPQEAERISDACPFRDRAGRLAAGDDFICGAGIQYSTENFEILASSKNGGRTEFKLSCRMYMPEDEPLTDVVFTACAVDTEDGLRLERLFGNDFTELRRLEII